MKKVYSTPKILAKEMDYLHCVLQKNNYPEWMMKELEKNPSTSIINPETGLDIKKIVFISLPYVSGFSEEFRSIFNYTGNPQR